MMTIQRCILILLGAALFAGGAAYIMPDMREWFGVWAGIFGFVALVYWAVLA